LLNEFSGRFRRLCASLMIWLNKKLFDDIITKIFFPRKTYLHLSIPFKNYEIMRSFLVKKVEKAAKDLEYKDKPF
jgi:hypothetical protein